MIWRFKIIKSVVILLTFLFFLPFFGQESICLSKTKKSKSKSAKISKIVNDKTKKSKYSKKKKKRKVVVKKVSLNAISILEKREITPGVLYKKVQFGVDPHRIIVHLVEVDIDSTPFEVKVLKAKNSVDGLDYLRNIYDDYQFELSRIYGGSLLTAINANFWSAFRNYPIGIFISEGEVISMKKYKEWSSVFFDLDNRPYIDNFELTCELIFQDGKRVIIDNVNRRGENDYVVLYNKYFGDSVPKLQLYDLEKVVNETIASIINNLDFSDTSEVEIDTNQIREQIIQARKQESKEYLTKKLIFRYIDPLVINKKVLVEFIGYDTGIVAIPNDGFVLTYSSDFPMNHNFKKGERCYLFFATDRYRYIPFRNAVSGTPRLVRKGIAKHEAYEEGSRGFRFIGAQLPRTVIGTNMSKTKIFLFVVESSKSAKSLGANLSQLSIIAKKLGCYDAMNLDGGGSSIMLVDGRKVGGNEESNGRRISGAIGISIRKR